MSPIRNISYLSPMCCNFCEICIKSHKIDQGCSTPLNLKVKIQTSTFFLYKIALHIQASSLFQENKMHYCLKKFSGLGSCKGKRFSNGRSFLLGGNEWPIAHVNSVALCNSTATCTTHNVPAIMYDSPQNFTNNRVLLHWIFSFFFFLQITCHFTWYECSALSGTSSLL